MTSAGLPAREAGVRPGDELVRLEGQPLASLADVSWALHQVPDEGTLAAVVRRGDATVELTIRLPAGWHPRGHLAPRGHLGHARLTLTLPMQ